MEQRALEKLVNGFERAYPAAITDMLDREFGLCNQWLGPEIRPLHPEMRVAGPAFTMRWVNDPSRVIAAKVAERLKRIAGGLTPFCVPVIDSGKSRNAGYWGELMCTICKERSVRGAVIDGGVRDPYFIWKSGFNLFCSFACPNEATGRSQLESIQEPILINGVEIRPGDFLVAEMGGVIVVPQDIVNDVYDKVMELVQTESETRTMIRAGVSLDEVLKDGRRI